MKPRILALSLLALFSLAWNADAQGQRRYRPRPAAPVNAEPNFGSVERTRLLEQVRVRRGGSRLDVLRLGSVERRAALTGASIHVPELRRRLLRR